MKQTNKFSKETTFILLFTIGALILRLVYVMRIPYTLNQHDAGDFTSGHIGYIFYLLEHNWRLPDFNPTTVWSFYHPPIHHYVAAIVAKISMLFGADKAMAMENVQLLIVFYGILILFVAYKLMKKFNLSGFSLLLPYAFLAFHPSLVMLSGSINNDSLCLLLSLITIYMTILWYENPTLKRIIVLALLFAVTMLTKMSGLLLAPAIAVVFLAKLIKEKEARKQLWKQFITFGVVCIPLALSFSIRNLVLWHVNPFFTLDLGEYMYTGNNLLERLVYIHKEQLTSPFVVYNVTPDNMLAVDRNIILYLFKTALFGDKFFLAADSVFIPYAWTLHVINALLVAITFACLIIEIVHTLLKAWNEKTLFPYIKELFIGLLYGASMGSFFLFCFKYPNSCSQDFRYIQLALFMHMLFLGLFLKRTGEKNIQLLKCFRGGLVLLTVLFVLLTFVLYFNCATT